MKKIILLTLIIVVPGLLAGCSRSARTDVAVNRTSTPSAANRAPRDLPKQDLGQEAPRMSLAEAKKHFDDKTAVFIDTHSASQFELEHIPGAINIQPGTIDQNINKIPKNKKIIVYCS